MEAPPRDRLLEAADVRFRRFGFRHTSVEAIARSAGTGKGSMYLHYRSKEALYLDVVAQAVNGFLDVATSAMNGVDGASDRLRALVGAAVEYYENDELLRAILVGDDDLVGGSVARLADDVQRDKVTSLIASTLREGQHAGTIRSDLDPRRSAIVLYEIGWAIVRRHLERGLDLPLADALSTLNDIVGRGTMQHHN